MNRHAAAGMLVLAGCGVNTAVHAQQAQAELSKPAVPLVSVVGCASRTPQGAWTLTNATNGTATRTLFMTAAEIDEARKGALGTNLYTLLGAPEFVTKDELLKSGERAEFTRPEIANATGQLQNGRRVFVKGLLITAPNERRLNLVAVQQLADTCK